MPGHIINLTKEIQKTEAFLKATEGSSQGRKDIEEYLIGLKRNYQSIAGCSYEARPDIQVTIPKRDLGDKI